MLTRMCEITFEAPQLRIAGFYPSTIEQGIRSEQSVNLALAEMYVHPDGHPNCCTLIAIT